MAKIINYDKYEEFLRNVGVEWTMPALDYDVNTCGWFEDINKHIIGQDWDLEEWIEKNYPKEFKELFYE